MGFDILWRQSVNERLCCFKRVVQLVNSLIIYLIFSWIYNIKTRILEYNEGIQIGRCVLVWLYLFLYYGWVI
jgi:hypothetical protein